MTDSWRRQYDAYLFDLDGTLVDTAPDIAAGLNHALVQAGLNPVDSALTRHWVGHGARMALLQALQDQGAYTDEVLEELLPQFLEHYGNNVAVHSQIYPEVESTLETLRSQGAKLAVVTNKLTRFSEPLLTQIGLREHFDLVVCGDTTSTPKPDAAPVIYCLDEFSVAAGDTLFVGDSSTDVDAARAAGVPVVCVRDGYNHGVDVVTLNPDGVIDSFAELLID